MTAIITPSSRQHDRDPVVLGAGDLLLWDYAVRQRPSQRIGLTVSANGASRNEQEEIEGEPADEQQADSDAGDDERAASARSSALATLLRPDRRGDMLGQSGGGVVCLVGWHWDQSLRLRRRRAEARTCW